MKKWRPLKKVLSLICIGRRHPVALKAINDYFYSHNKNSALKEVRLIAYSEKDYTYFSNYLNNKAESGLTKINEPSPDFLNKSSSNPKSSPPLLFKIE